jgi:transposase InsO family protein
MKPSCALDVDQVFRLGTRYDPCLPKRTLHLRGFRSLYRYRSRRPDSAPLRARIEEIAAVKRRYGYRRVYLRLRREGWEVNRKRVYRLYRDAGLAVRRRKPKRIGPLERKPLPKPTAANVSWSMDFVADGLIGGRRLRCLTIVDDCTRECLAIEVDTSITGLLAPGQADRQRVHRSLQWSAAAGMFELILYPI